MKDLFLSVAILFTISSCSMTERAANGELLVDNGTFQCHKTIIDVDGKIDTLVSIRDFIIEDAYEYVGSSKSGNRKKVGEIIKFRNASIYRQGKKISMKEIKCDCPNIILKHSYLESGGYYLDSI